MALSKPVELLQSLVLTYLERLNSRPIRTKSITSCIIASLGNITLQNIAGAKMIDQDSVVAFGLFGLLFGGPVPHFFYENLESMFPENTSKMVFLKFGIERLLFTPFYQFLSLYVLSRFEGKSHEDTMKQIYAIYWPILKANWQIVSLIQFFNVKFVPPMLHVLFHNMVGFFWAMFITYKKRNDDFRRANIVK
ncbi:PXMP2/4 family protein 3 [Sipha flava]|uniref:PXMP2/4 family protein 3 n=1 Tax=Sipha flava TaxID=143950 RepID=A0A2S2Q5X8_9HEMI|nr:PXMP2/4 family protein 3 [Sipha flava]